MKYALAILFPITACCSVQCQAQRNIVDSFRLADNIKITIDRPAAISNTRETIIIFYALPNGNTTEQTMGKKMEAGDDWHFGIQHIAAQTRFVRRLVRDKNFVVIYLENDLKAWPAWKQQHPDFRTVILHLVDSLSSLIRSKHKSIYLNGHSGGGSFIFGYLAAVDTIPPTIKRISFLDSDYGYDSSYYNKIKCWLQLDKTNALNVFAYNDSIALYNGKPFVSPTGGTWYRSHLFLEHLERDMAFKRTETDSLVIYKSVTNKQVQFYFKKNTDRGIYHTQQVEFNGFIHSVLCGTKYDSKKYSYYGPRAYNSLIRPE